jgi:hypothetical protein
MRPARRDGDRRGVFEYGGPVWRHDVDGAFDGTHRRK